MELIFSKTDSLLRRPANSLIKFILLVCFVVISDASILAQVVDCLPYVSTDGPYTGYVNKSALGYDSHNYVDIKVGEGLLGTENRGWVIYDLSNIPDEAVIEEVYLGLWIKSGFSSSSSKLNLRRLNGDIYYSSSYQYYHWSTDGDLFDAIGGYPYGDVTSGFLNVDNYFIPFANCNLGSTGVYDLQNQLNNNYPYFGVGFWTPDGDNDDIELYGRITHPYLHVVYSMPFLNVSPSNRDVSYPAGTTTFTVDSNIGWTVSSNQSWCSVTPSGTGDGTISATYSANTGTGQRIATITVSGPNVATRYVTVTQMPTPVLSVTPPNREVTSSAGNTNFAVDSNIGWTVSSNQSWCSVTPSGTGTGTIIATYNANSGTGQRIATITVSGTGVATRYVTVTQLPPPTVTVSPANRDVPYPAGSTTFTVASNVAWTASSDQSWCSVTNSGSGNGTITAAFSANTGTDQRIATITVFGAGATTRYVTVTQSATPSLTVSPTNQDVTSSAGTTSFSVVSNVTWTASSNQSWCSVTGAGSGNGTITAAFGANTGTGQRIATITVSGTGVSARYVTVTQLPPPMLTVTPSNREVPSTAGTTTFTVSSNNAWTASSNQSWCSVTGSGSGNGTITATYNNNTTTGSRVATITVSAAGLPNAYVTVTQLPPSTLTVTPSNRDVASTAGTTTFTVTSTVAWTASSNQSWCSVTNSGSGNGTITVTYNANTGTGSRIATITVSGSGVADRSVTVTQSGVGASLTVTPSNQDVSSSSGTTSFSVVSNVTWTASSNQSWCSVTNSGSGSGTISATYNANTGTGSRIATITVSGFGVADRSVTVTQSGVGPSLTVTPLNHDVTSSSGSRNFSIVSNVDWTASSNQSWCSVTGSGSGNATITATYSANTGTGTRIATITISGSGVGSRVVTITQSGVEATLTVTPLNQNVGSTAGMATYSVVSNTSWTASSNAGWCSVTYSGSGNSILTAAYTTNTGTGVRMASITVSGSGTGSRVVTLTQAGVGPFLTLTPSNQDVTSSSGTTSFNVASNVAWTATSNQSWCSVTSSGSGNGSITATYSANTATTPRTATITVSGSGVAATYVTVTQSSGTANNLADIGLADYWFYPLSIHTGEHPSAVGFQLINNGPADMTGPNINCQASYYLSRNNTFGDNDDIMFGQLLINQEVLSGTSVNLGLTEYGLSNLTIPPSVSGNYYIFMHIRPINPSVLVDPISSNNVVVLNEILTVLPDCDPATIVVNPVNQEVCPGDGEAGFSIIAAGSGPLSYQWQYYRNGSWVDVMNGIPSGAEYVIQTPNELTVRGILTPGSYQYRCYVTNCTSTTVASDPATLTVNTPPDIPVIAEVIYPDCLTSTGSLYFTNMPEGTWRLVRNPGNIEIVATGRAYTVTGLAAGEYQFTVYNIDGCSSLTPIFVTLEDHSGIPAIPDQAISVNSDDPFVFGPFEAHPELTFIWDAPVYDGEVTGGTGQTSPQDFISGTLSIPMGEGTAVYTVTPILSSCEGDPFTLTVTVTSDCIPVEILENPVNATVCQNGGEATFSLRTEGTLPYEFQWQYFNSGIWTNVSDNMPDGSHYSVNSISGSLVVSGTSRTGIYQFRCRISNCNSRVVYSDIVTLTVTSVPGVPLISQVIQPDCHTESGSVTLSGLPQGTWRIVSIPGAVDISGSGSTYTITGLAPNMYVFTVSGGSGCVSGISEEVTIFPRAEEVNPPVVGNVTQPTCNNEFGSVVLNGLPAVGMWTLIQYPGQIYTNGLGSTLVISGLSPGTYSWIVTDPRGCSSPISEQVVINSVSSGAVPEITLKYNDLLICADKDNSFTSYQWFDEGKVIPNATGQYYQTHKKPGVYHVVTVDVNGCTNTSNTITLEAEKSLSAFPNPTSGSFSLSLNNFSEGEAIVRILSSAGMKVMEFNVESLDAAELKQIPVDKLENGVYIIQVTVNKAENYFTRIVVAK